MLTIGLTGGIAAGKSTVARALVERGASHVDADAISHELTAPGGAAVDAVAAAFGEGVRDAAGGIDRAALGRIVFRSGDRRAELEAILHPMIRREIGSRRDALRREGAVRLLVVEAALLVEAERARAYDQLLVVEAPDDVKIARLVAGRGLSREDAAERVRAQLPAGRKLLAADVALWNDGDEATLERRCDEIWRHLTTTNRSGPVT